jgi:DNA-binding MarR family transcriptional regulator
MATDHSMLGTLLRQLLERLDRDVENAYRERGLEFRPRYTSIVRLLIEREALRVGEIVAQTRVSQPSISATLAAMQRDDLITSSKGEDARARVIKLTSKARAMIPALQEQWRITAAAANSLHRDLGLDLEQLASSALEQLDRVSFRDRMGDARSPRGPRGGAAGD